MTTTRVHRILDEVGALAFPGVYDTLSAKIAQKVGFPLAFVSGIRSRPPRLVNPTWVCSLRPR